MASTQAQLSKSIPSLWDLARFAILYTIVIQSLAKAVTPFRSDGKAKWIEENADHHRWAKKAHDFLQRVDCKSFHFTTLEECKKITHLDKTNFSVYLAPKSPYGRYIMSIPDAVLCSGHAHDAVLVLDPYPEASLGHVILIFFVNATTSRWQCQQQGGIHLDKDECMFLAQRDRCYNVPARKLRRRSFIQRCEINFLPTVRMDTEEPSTKRTNHLRCLSDLPGYHACPEFWLSNVHHSELCDPLSHNSHHCVTTPDTIRSGCRVYEVCDQTVILSGGWNSLAVANDAAKRVIQMAQLFKRNGIKRRNIKIFHANGIGQIKTNEDEQHLKVYPSAMKLALRHHLQLMCGTKRCVDSLVLYLNSPTLHSGTMLLWDLNGNGLAEEMERYSIEEFLSDIANCSATFVQVFVDQSYAGHVSHAVKLSRHHKNVIVMTSGRGHEYSHAGEFTQYWSNISDTRMCTVHVHRASIKALTQSHPTISNSAGIKRTLSGAPCDVKPPFRKENFGGNILDVRIYPQRFGYKISFTVLENPKVETLVNGKDLSNPMR